MFGVDLVLLKNFMEPLLNMILETYVIGYLS